MGNPTQIDLSGNTLLVSSNFIPVTGNTLLPAGADANVLFNKTSGATVTLPAPAKCPLGTQFNFYIQVACTTNTYKIITDAATTFLAGGVNMDKALTVTRYAADGTTHRSVNLDGTGNTKGGNVGDFVKLTLISPTQWTVEGMLSASGTLATPFATT